MEQTKEITVTQSQDVELNMFSSVQGFEIGQRMAKVFASSTLVPQAYQGNIGNCMIGLNMAVRMKADPLMVFQNLVIVHGTPTFEAKFAIACFNATGKYTPIRYQEFGDKKDDTYGTYAYAIDKATGDVLKGPEISIKTAKEEGWYDRNPKWKTIPQLMLRYRSASWFIRTTDPGVMMGFQTREEVEDAEYTEIKDEPETSTFVPDESNENTETLDITTEPVEQPVNPTKEQATEETKDEKKVKPAKKQKAPDIFSES